MPRSSPGGGGWAQVELTDALRENHSLQNKNHDMSRLFLWGGRQGAVKKLSSHGVGKVLI